MIDIYINGLPVAAFNEMDHCRATSLGNNLPKIAGD